MKPDSRAPGRVGALTTAPDRSPGGVALGALGATLSCSTGLRSFERLRGRLERTNFRGRTVSLRGGIGVAVGAVAAGARVGSCAAGPSAPGSSRVAVAALVATMSAGAAGLVDDMDAGAHDGGAPAKGLAGHLGALARGRVTTGVIKIAVIGSGALVSGVLLARHRSAVGARGPCATAVDAATSAVDVAAWANVLNLLDRRPSAEAARILAAGVLGTAVAALPEDLMEDTMLGDTGSNALGALVGAALAAHPGRAVRTAAALAGTALILTSERVSFTRVIARTPALALLDSLGRRPS